MISVVKAPGATLSNGALPLIYRDTAGVLRDVFAATYQIFTADFTTQVFPGSGAQSIDVAPAGANRIGVGRYAALWVATAATVGRFYIRWSVTPKSGDAPISFDQEFELVTDLYHGPHYAQVQDLRDEGITSTMLTDANAQKAIVRASRYVEMFTGRSFVPSYRVVEVDGRSARALIFDEPIVAVEKIVVTFDSVFSVATQATDLTTLKIYNRHLTEGLVQPDDRESPKIEYVHGRDLIDGSEDGSRSIFGERLIWPTGRRNIQVTGIFGYTEPDGSFVGQTPDLVREATKMFVVLYLPKLFAGLPSFSGPIIRERTRDQEVEFAALRVSAMTGIRAIDNILAAFRRPPSFGAA